MTIDEIKLQLTTDQTLMLDQWFLASKMYYTEEPILPDSVFDELEEELVNLNIPELTNFIKTTIFNKTEMVVIDEYTQEMISLKKEKYKDRSSVVEIKKPFIGIKKQLMYAPKFDGASLKITFDSQHEYEVKQILTRGGLDITNQFKNHKDIQEQRKFKLHIICGELLCPKTVFNTKYSDEGDGEYKNARNFVGGLVKTQNIPESIKNDLRFEACTDGINPLFAGNYNPSESWWTPMRSEDFYHLDEIMKKYKSDDFAYLCDGIVIAYEEEGDRRVKDNYPLNMLAVKFPAPRAKAKVIGFSWSQKKAGKLTPKVLIEDTYLEGSTCTCANGYNYEYLLDHHIGIGSIVEIEKSGDIIPIVVKTLSNSNVITMPDCEYERKGKHLIALDLELTRQYKFILGLRSLNIDGIGETLGEQIGDVVNFSIFDLFNPVYKPAICQVLGGGKNWQKFQEFYTIKKLPLDHLIILHQFNGVGLVIAKKIALLLLKKSHDTSNISGDVMSNVCSGEGFKRINESIQFLKVHGINIVAPSEISDETITFEMTGDPPGMSKAQFILKFKEMYPNSEHIGLTKTTKFLFCEDINGQGGKCNKARKYNIKRVSYKDALNNNL